MQSLTACGVSTAQLWLSPSLKHVQWGRYAGTQVTRHTASVNNHRELPRVGHGQSKKYGRVSGLKEGFFQEPGSDLNAASRRNLFWQRWRRHADAKEG